MKYLITSFHSIIFQRFNLFKSCLVVSSMWWTFELIITWTVVVQVVFGKDISILEYLVTSFFLNLYLVNDYLMHDKDFQKNVETRLDIWDHLATIFLYSYTLELCVYYAWKRTSKILKSIYVYILNILRLHRIKISNLVHFFWPRLSWVLWEGSYIVNHYTYYFGGLAAHPCFLLSSHNIS